MSTSLLFIIGNSIAASLVFVCLTVLFRLCLKYRYRLRLTSLNTAITKGNNKIDENARFHPIDIVDFRRTKYKKSHISPVDLGFDWSKILPKNKKGEKKLKSSRNKRKNYYLRNNMNTIQTNSDCLKPHSSKTLRFSPTVYTIIHAKNGSQKNDPSDDTNRITDKSTNMKTSTNSTHLPVYTCNKYGYHTSAANRFIKPSITSSGDSGSESKIGDSTMDEMDDEDAIIFAATKLEDPEN